MNVLSLPPIANDVPVAAMPFAPPGGDGAEFEQMLDRTLRDETRSGTDRPVEDRVPTDDGPADAVAGDEPATDEPSTDEDRTTDEPAAASDGPTAPDPMVAPAATPVAAPVAAPTPGTEDPDVVALDATGPAGTGPTGTEPADAGTADTGSTETGTTTPEPVDLPTTGGTDTPTDQGVEQPTDQPVDQPVDQPTDQPVDQSTNQSADPSIEPLATEAPTAPLTRPGAAAAGDAAAAGTDAAERLLRMNELVDAARATLRHRGTERLVLELHPAELGSVTVDLRLDGQAVNVALRAAHPGAVERLLGELAQLRQDLAEAGIDVGDLDVHSGSQGRPGERDRADGPAGSDLRRSTALTTAETTADRAVDRARHLANPITTNGRLAVDL
jgi:hypothetical protein